MTTENYDIVVIGAGASGLSFANWYRELHPHAKVLVLEASDAPGGSAASRRKVIIALVQLPIRIEGFSFNGTRGEGRTLNLRLRRPTLYPIELLAQTGKKVGQQSHGGNC